ncbi:MAG TPA: DUF3300 domain-containing protein [Candidatus Binataceae bacterium]|nr:DUF3300 domain-containing protein [Candidatus Binataceae bacterium]
MTISAGLFALTIDTIQQTAVALADSPMATPAVSAPPPPANSDMPGPAPGKATQQQLEQLVSPIALYPDILVAQILAASTYPTQIVEADRWLQQNKNLKGKALTDAVSQQPWDPSVKSLCQYAPVLDNLNQNLSWTSALGQAYYNQPTDVMSAIQTLRNMALKSGNLKSGPQQTVKVEPSPPPATGTSSTTIVAQSGTTVVTQPNGSSQTIIIEPTQPQVVYVPSYNPTTAYGQPMAAPPGYSGADLMMASMMSFGVGMLVGDMIGSSSNNWGCNWHGGNVVYNKNVYVSNSNVYPSRSGYGYRPPNGYNHPYYGNNAYPRPYNSPYAKNNPYGSYHEPTMPKQYNSYGDWNKPVSQQNQFQNQNRPMNQNESRYANNERTPNSNWNNNAFRGYHDQNSNPDRSSWGNMGKQQPGGFTQASSSRGRDSYSGNTGRWGGGGWGGGGGGGRSGRFR